MLKYLNIDETTHKIIYVPKNKNRPIFKNISECRETDCVYSRSNTQFRSIFERKIISISNKKKNINILFYGSFMLLQEIKILDMIHQNVSEVHFVDVAYQEMYSLMRNKYNALFSELMQYVHHKSWDLAVFVHRDPVKLSESTCFKNRFDMICGIDVDYKFHIINNRFLMKKIAQNTLCTSGKLVSSMHYENMVDLCIHKFDIDRNLELCSVTDYVKKKYFLQIKFKSITIYATKFIKHIMLIISIMVMNYYLWISIIIMIASCKLIIDDFFLLKPKIPC